MKKKKIVVAIGGSSGSIYAKVLLDKLKTLTPQIEAVGIVMSDNAILNWRSGVPRHSEVNNHLARKICRDLGVPEPNQFNFTFNRTCEKAAQAG